jgi:hypothetical protein
MRAARNRTKRKTVDWMYVLKVLVYVAVFACLCWALWGPHRDSNHVLLVEAKNTQDGWCMEDKCDDFVGKVDSPDSPPQQMVETPVSEFAYSTKWLDKKKKVRITLQQDKEPVTFSDWIQLMKTNSDFVDKWFQVFDDLPFRYPGMFFEVPPMIPENLQQPFECVLISAPKFKSFSPSTSFFEPYFTAPALATSFLNLGGDTLLVSPNPLAGRPLKYYTHLGIFMAKAQDDQKRGFWKLVAENYEERIKERKPVWLSTEGSGVYYLHIRLDPRPKYYHHTPYRNPEFFST